MIFRKGAIAAELGFGGTGRLDPRREALDRLVVTRFILDPRRDLSRPLDFSFASALLRQAAYAKAMPRC